MKMRYLFLFSIIFLSGCTVNINLIPPERPLEERHLEGKGKDKILLMDITGVIIDRERKDTLRSEPSIVSEIKDILQMASSDNDIRGLIIRINSPGGSVSASDIIYHEIKEFRKKRGIPVYAFITDTGTSGALYVAMSADRIYAMPASITGSIGVIAMKFNMEGLLTKIGVQSEVIKSGDKKDFWSPWRGITEEEKKMFQSIIDEFYERFIDVIYMKNSAVLKREEIRALADGRIFTGEEARRLRIIDKTGYLDNAINDMKESLGLRDARVVTYSKGGRYKSNIYSQEKNGINISINPEELFHEGINFMYIWIP